MLFSTSLATFTPPRTSERQSKRDTLQVFLCLFALTFLGVAMVKAILAPQVVVRMRGVQTEWAAKMEDVTPAPGNEQRAAELIQGFRRDSELLIKVALIYEYAEAGVFGAIGLGFLAWAVGPFRRRKPRIESPA